MVLIGKFVMKKIPLDNVCVRFRVETLFAESLLAGVLLVDRVPNSVFFEIWVVTQCLLETLKEVRKEQPYPIF